MLNKPSSGSININGIDTSEINCREYWKLCSVLPQDHNEYSMSIAENILMREIYDSDDDSIWQSLEYAGLKGKVENTPNGIYTPFTRLFFDSGVEFSGGEKQRLSISRMIAKEASLYIMDEPSSSLDPSFEDDLNKYISNITSQKTVIIISHRLSSVKMCDRVIFMKDGFIIADGTHESIYNTCFEYKEMFDNQLNKYSI